jgi:hypothetical protein
MFIIAESDENGRFDVPTLVYFLDSLNERRPKRKLLMRALVLAGLMSMALGGCASNKAADDPGARVRDTILTAKDTIHPNDTLTRVRDSVADSTRH